MFTAASPTRRATCTPRRWVSPAAGLCCAQVWLDVSPEGGLALEQSSACLRLIGICLRWPAACTARQSHGSRALSPAVLCSCHSAAVLTSCCTLFACSVPAEDPAAAGALRGDWQLQPVHRGGARGAPGLLAVPTTLAGLPAAVLAQPSFAQPPCCLCAPLRMVVVCSAASSCRTSASLAP